MGKFIVQIIGAIIIIGLFGIVLIKYYDVEQKSSIGKMLHPGVIINGYKVQDYIDKERITASFSKIQEEANQNRSGFYTTNSIPVLVYHGISPQENGKDITIKQFEEHMLTLKKAGYQTITLDQLYAFMRGELQLPAKSFVLTFDDGRKDSYYFTDYTLKVLNYTAVIFVITKYSIDSNHPYYLNLEELEKMEKSGRWEIQSHSYDGHGRVKISKEGKQGSFFGNKMWLDAQDRLENDIEYKNRIHDNIAKAKTSLEEKFQREIHSFAIPFSDFGQFESNFPDANKINEEIYQKFHKMFFYQYKPIKNRDYRANYNNQKKDTYFVIRMTVYPDSTAKDLLAEIEASQEIKLPYQEKFDNHFHWLGIWGNFTYTQNMLSLINTREFGTTLSYLDGSYLLTNYNVTVGISEINNSTFSLITRFQNSDTYSHCVFNDKYIVFESIIDGKQVSFARARLPFNKSLSSAKTIGSTVKNQYIECLIDDSIVYSSNTSHIPPYGGVALKSWLPDNRDHGFIKVHSVEMMEVKS